MLRQLLVGGAISACNIGIHALVMTLVVRAAHIVAYKRTTKPSTRLAGVMIVTILVLMVAHTSEVMVWALAYSMVNAVAPEVNPVYFAFVNYTTLGYGDVVPLPGWQLIGPITAMNGVLLFGWSTAVIFEVLRRTMGK
jgi:hypothetical protein